MRALVEKADGYEVVLIASNKPGADGLSWARERGLPTWSRDSRGVAKEEYDRSLAAVLGEYGVGTIALAGFMRILSPWFVEQWRGRILNIHPSLLPNYPGLDTHARALAANDAVSGCSVHVVTEELDAGEVLGQSEVPVQPGDTPQSLEQRVLAAEHDLYAKVLSEFVNQ
jgi:phosphoribosylglycinamide formyltransferase-1